MKDAGYSVHEDPGGDRGIQRFGFSEHRETVPETPAADGFPDPVPFIADDEDGLTDLSGKQGFSLEMPAYGQKSFRYHLLEG